VRVALAVLRRRHAGVVDESAAQRICIGKATADGDLFGCVPTALEQAAGCRHPRAFHPGGMTNAETLPPQA
jgi:hypothetical protein